MKVIKVDKVILKEIEELASNIILVFKCQSLIDNVLKLFEIKYDLKTCKKTMYKF